MTNAQKIIFLLLRLPPMALLLFFVITVASLPSLNVKCRQNAAKAPVCQVTESSLFLKQHRNFYPISATYDGTYNYNKSGNYTSYQMIFLDASAQQLRVGKSSRNKAFIEATVAEASAFLAAKKSQSYEWRDDHTGVVRWFVMGFVGLMVLLMARDIRQTLALPIAQRDAA
jgi:hypothetical protein